MKGYLYFISNNNGHIKIGQSSNPKARIAALQTGTPYVLSLYKTVEFDNPTMAYGAEKEMHEIFMEFRITGEWFEEKPIKDFLSQNICRTKNYAWDNSDVGGSINDFPSRMEEEEEWLNISLYDVLSTDPSNADDYESGLFILLNQYLICEQLGVHAPAMCHALALLKTMKKLPERSNDGRMDQSTSKSDGESNGDERC